MANSNEMRSIDGACHCGNIRFTFALPAAESPIRIRACSCSFCIKHGGVYTSHPQGRVAIQIADPAIVERYAFGTKTADFLICRRCGVLPVVTSLIEETLYAVVNVNTLEGVDRSEFDESTTDFEGEETADRLARRRHNWVPVVTIDPAD